MQPATQVTSPMRVRAALKEALEQQKIANTPTLIMSAMALESLPVDEHGRAYLEVKDGHVLVLDLIKRAVATFKHATGYYPSEICLSAFHYLTYGMLWGHYYVEDVRIPYKYEGSMDRDVGYDILVRGGDKPFDGN